MVIPNRYTTLFNDLQKMFSFIVIHEGPIRMIPGLGFSAWAVRVVALPSGRWQGKQRRWYSCLPASTLPWRRHLAVISVPLKVEQMREEPKVSG